jgi:hypothetical protein
MFGPELEKDTLKGIIPRAIRCAQALLTLHRMRANPNTHTHTHRTRTHVYSQLFAYITRTREDTEFAIKCSFLEIYKERIRDLLNPKNANLKVRETPSRGVWVDGITEEVRTSDPVVRARACSTSVCVS